MRAVEWATRATVVLCLLYGAVVIADPVPEKFPIFSWSLFSKVPPATGQDYNLRFTEINGTPIDPPLYFPQLKTYFKAAGAPGAYALARQWGGDIDRDSPRATQSRTLFEAAYLQDISSARYEVVRRTFDRRERFACEAAGRLGSDCFTEETVIGEFELGR